MNAKGPMSYQYCETSQSGKILRVGTVVSNTAEKGQRTEEQIFAVSSNSWEIFKQVLLRMSGYNTIQNKTVDAGQDLIGSLARVLYSGN